MALHPRIMNLWNKSKKQDAKKLILQALTTMFFIGSIMLFIFWSNNDFIFHGDTELFQFGLDIITYLCDGTTHLNLDRNSNSAKVFNNCSLNSTSGLLLLIS